MSRTSWYLGCPFGPTILIRCQASKQCLSSFKGLCFPPESILETFSSIFGPMSKECGFQGFACKVQAITLQTFCVLSFPSKVNFTPGNTPAGHICSSRKFLSEMHLDKLIDQSILEVHLLHCTHSHLNFPPKSQFCQGEGRVPELASMQDIPNGHFCVSL